MLAAVKPDLDAYLNTLKDGVLKTIDILTAISGLILIRPLRSFDSVGRDIFNALAASVTDRPKGSKFSLAPCNHHLIN